MLLVTFQAVYFLSSLHLGYESYWSKCLKFCLSFFSGKPKHAPNNQKLNRLGKVARWRLQTTFCVESKERPYGWLPNKYCCVILWVIEHFKTKLKAKIQIFVLFKDKGMIVTDSFSLYISNWERIEIMCQDFFFFFLILDQLNCGLLSLNTHNHKQVLLVIFQAVANLRVGSVSSCWLGPLTILFAGPHQIKSGSHKNV